MHDSDPGRKRKGALDGDGQEWTRKGKELKQAEGAAENVDDRGNAGGGPHGVCHVISVGGMGEAPAASLLGGKELPGPRLGDGVRWDLRRAVERTEARLQQPGGIKGGCGVSREDVAWMSKGLQGMLEQALSCSRYADVWFEFDDGTRPLKGHRSLLCSISKEFGRMFESGMLEDRTGVVRVRSVTPGTFRGFLEWMYLGRPGNECKAADGRELWLLSEVYDVGGLERWICGGGLDDSNLCAAFEFGLVDEGDRSALVEGCRKHAMRGLSGVTSEALKGAGGETVKKLVGYVVEGNRRRKGVLDAFKFLVRWFHGNGGWGGCRREDVDDVLGMLDLVKLSGRELRDVVKASGLVSAERLSDVALRKIGDGWGDVKGYSVVQQFLGTKDSPSRLQCLSDVAVYGEGPHQMVAAVDSEGCRVHLYNVQTGACHVTVGSRGTGQGQFQSPCNVAFNARGEVHVTDNARHCVAVFDLSGAYLRTIGEEGDGDGQFACPNGIAFDQTGHMLVADYATDRVQVLRGDGTFVRSFGCEGKGPGQLDGPFDIAVAGDGTIFVVDQGNFRVQAFDSEGNFLRMFGGWGACQGHFIMPCGVAVGADGEILVSDWQRNDVQVFTPEGIYVQSVGEYGCTSNGILVDGPHGVACDGSGRVFVGCHRSGRVVMLE